MVGTTGEDVSFEVCVVGVVTVDEDVTPEAIEVLEVRKCGDVISSVGVDFFEFVNR